MIYLDNAATSYPKPNEVYDEVLRAMKVYGANPGVESHDMAVMAASKVMETREELCSLFNIQNPFNIVFTSNATEALNIGIKGLLKKGDHVISTVIEHNSVLRPLNSLSSKGVQVTFLGVDKNGYINMGDLKKEIRKNTKAIIINHASNVIGTIQYIKGIGELARQHGATFMVDGSQSAGIVAIDVERYNIDLLAFPGHKGLFGPQGTGGLFIREGVTLNSFKEGSTGRNSNSMSQPDFLPDKFESGTPNTAGIAGLCEGVKFIKKVGRKNIKIKEEILTRYLIEELKKLPYIKLYGNRSIENRCSVVSFNIEGLDSSTVGCILNKEGIAIRTGHHSAPLIHSILGTFNTGTARVSAGYFNTFQDIEKLVEAIMRINKNH